MKRKTRTGPVHYRPPKGRATYLRPEFNPRHRGVPKEHCKRCHITLPLDVVSILDKHPNRSALLTYLVRSHDQHWRRSLKILDHAGFSDPTIIWFSKVCSKMGNIYSGLTDPKFALPKTHTTQYEAPPKGAQAAYTLMTTRETRFLCRHLEILITEILAGNRAALYSVGIFDDLPTLE